MIHKAASVARICMQVLRLEQYLQWTTLRFVSWWRHQMETFSALLAICAGNSPVSGEFPAQRPVTQTFDVFYGLCPIKGLSKQWWGWWFGTPSRPFWRHCIVKIPILYNLAASKVYYIPQTSHKRTPHMGYQIICQSKGTKSLVWVNFIHDITFWFSILWHVYFVSFCLYTNVESGVPTVRFAGQ